jgi:hypothetical protein
VPIGVDRQRRAVPVAAVLRQLPRRVTAPECPPLLGRTTLGPAQSLTKFNLTKIRLTRFSTPYSSSLVSLATLSVNEASLCEVPDETRASSQTCSPRHRATEDGATISADAAVAAAMFRSIMDKLFVIRSPPYPPSCPSYRRTAIA